MHLSGDAQDVALGALDARGEVVCALALQLRQLGLHLFEGLGDFVRRRGEPAVQLATDPRGPQFSRLLLGFMHNDNGAHITGFDIVTRPSVDSAECLDFCGEVLEGKI